MPQKYQRITELDFERIKTNFRRFLESQEQFTDYDFAGSGMDVLLDMFAYDTHYNAFYLNAGINESFLSTATKRRNVTKGIRPYAYIPRSKTGASVDVDITITIPLNTLISIFGGTDYGTVQLQRYNRFNTKIDGTNFIFVNTNAINLVQQNDTTFTARNVRLRQGIPNTFRYVVDIQDDDQRFVIPSDNADVSTLNVYSNNPALSYNTQFRLFRDVPVEDTTSTTPIYFLYENSEGRYEIEFGDGRYGYKPVNGETIFMDYIIVNNKPANGAQVFTGTNKLYVSGNEIKDATISVTAKTRSSGGTERESLESMQYYAPKYYLAGGYAIVNSDYESIIRQQFPNIQSVNTWGGEENNPPKYGRTIIAAKPFGALYLTDIEKDVLRDSIRRKMVTTIRPEIIDPKYTYIRLNTTVRYDSELTVKTERDIQREIIGTIRTYADDRFNRFKYDFTLSDLISLVKNINSSFTSTDISVIMKKIFIPTVNIAKSYTFYFQNQIYYPYTGFVGSIYSTQFTYKSTPNCSFEQNSTGSLDIVATVNTVRTVIQPNVGSVDYLNGVIVLRAFSPDAYEGSGIQISAMPLEQNIKVRREFLLQLQDSDIAVSLLDVNDIVTNQNDETTVDVTPNAF